MARKIDKIIIHCSASPNGRPQTVQDIDAWHQARGFHRAHPVGNLDLKSIGYHFLIYIDGTIHAGRDICEIGAHAEGWNANSIGICMLGTDQFTEAQWTALAELVSDLRRKYPDAVVLGHKDLPNVHKLCPGFDVTAWIYSAQICVPGQTLSVKREE